MPVHLFVLVHGLWGDSNHLSAIEQTIHSNINTKDTLHTLKPKSSHLFKTYDGIEIIGSRMLVEILNEIATINKDDDVVKISFIGYSLGGLISRYLIGQLNNLKLFDKIEPISFTTFATPHLGVWFFPNKLKVLNVIGSNLIGMIGVELFIKDDYKILVKLSQNEYIDGLSKFKHRLLFANIRHDRTVNFYTSFIVDKNPFDEHWENLSISFKNTPSYNIKSISISPKIVDLTKSHFEQLNTKVSKLPNWKKFKYSLILITLAMFSPIWLPIILTVSIFGSLISYFIVKTYQRPNIETYHELIKDLSGKSLPLDEYDKNDQIKITNSSDNIQSFFKTINDYKNPDVSKFNIFNGSNHLGFDDDRLTILRNLNKLDWYKFPVYLNLLNAHDGIIARKGLKKSSIKGISIITFYSQLLNEFLNNDEINAD